MKVYIKSSKISDYSKMGEDQLANEIRALGDNPYGMTKVDMIRYLTGADIAKNMTDDELRDYARKKSQGNY